MIWNYKSHKKEPNNNGSVSQNTNNTVTYAEEDSDAVKIRKEDVITTMQKSTYSELKVSTSYTIQSMRKRWSARIVEVSDTFR